jgi:hypothetical protein
MVDPGADGRAATPIAGGPVGDGADASLLPGLDSPVDRPTDRRHGRRALWISIGALVVVGAIAWPVAGHLLRPAPERVRTPDTLAGLTLDRDADATATADYLRGAIAAGLDLDHSVGAVYDYGGNARNVGVLVVGGNYGSGTAASRLDALLGLLEDGMDGFTQVTDEAAGHLGGLVRCALSSDAPPTGSTGNAATPGTGQSASATRFAVCGWADDSTVGVALFPNRSVDQAAALFGRMRPGLLGQD